MLSRPITHVKLGDKRTALYKLTLGDIADLDSYIQDEYTQVQLDKARKIYADDIPAEVKFELMQDLPEDELEAKRGGLKGATYMIWQALKAEYPDITLEQAGRIETENLEKIVTAISPKEKKTSRQPGKKRK